MSVYTLSLYIASNKIPEKDSSLKDLKAIDEQPYLSKFAAVKSSFDRYSEGSIMRRFSICKQRRETTDIACFENLYEPKINNLSSESGSKRK